MARVTVEDCIEQIPNRFDLVMLSAHRARALASGAALEVERDRDKNPVVALRELAERKLDLEALNASLIKSLQKRIEPEHPEDEISEVMADEQNWVQTASAGMMDMGEEEEEEESAADEELTETDETGIVPEGTDETEPA